MSTTTKAQHTPGPWFTFEHRDHSGMEVGPRWDSDSEYLKDCVRAVCTIRAEKHSYPCAMSPEQQANANLIAAAPDILAALKELVRVVDGTSPKPLWAMRSAQEAIAKAKGQ